MLTHIGSTARRTLFGSAAFMGLAVAVMFGQVTPAAAAETQVLQGPFGTQIGVWETGCHSAVQPSWITRQLYIEEPFIRNATSTSFSQVRLTVNVWSKIPGGAWVYEPNLSYSKVAQKSWSSPLQPKVVSFGYQTLNITNPQFRGDIWVAQRLEYFDAYGRRVANPVDFNPSVYTSVYSYRAGIASGRWNGVCQF